EFVSLVVRFAKQDQDTAAPLSQGPRIPIVSLRPLSVPYDFPNKIVTFLKGQDVLGSSSSWLPRRSRHQARVHPHGDEVPHGLLLQHALQARRRLGAARAGRRPEGRRLRQPPLAAHLRPPRARGPVLVRWTRYAPQGQQGR